MKFISKLWFMFISLFKSANIKSLNPVPVDTPAPESVDAEEAVILSDLEKLKNILPRMETVTAVTSEDKFKEQRNLPRRQLTKNFHIDEFKCHDGVPVPEEMYPNVLELAENLQVLRLILNKPIRIISGYRHPEYNRKIGGARKSQHMQAKAADIKVRGMEPKDVADVVDKAMKSGHLKKGGVGRYISFTHIDIRGNNARWGTNTKK